MRWFTLLMVVVAWLDTPSVSGQELPYIDLEAPSFAGAPLDLSHHSLLSGESFSAFSPDGKLVAAFRGSQAFVWRVPTGELVWQHVLPRREASHKAGDREISTHFHVANIAFSADGRRLAIATSLPTSIQVWEFADASGKLEVHKSLELSSREFSKLVETPAGLQAIGLKWWSENELLVNMPGELFRVDTTKKPQVRRVIPRFHGTSIKFDVDPSDESDRDIRLITQKLSGDRGMLVSLARYRSDLAQTQTLTPPRFTELSSLSPSPNWQRIAGTNRTTHELSLFEAKSGETHLLSAPKSRWSAQMAWMSDSNTLAAVARPKSNIVFNHSRVARRDRSPEPTDNPFDTEEVGDDEVALTRIADSLVMWDVVQRKQLVSVELPESLAPMEVASFSPDDRYLLTASKTAGTEPGAFQIWDVAALRK